jgi:Tfp pilus assembly protein PilV
LAVQPRTTCDPARRARTAPARLRAVGARDIAESRLEAGFSVLEALVAAALVAMAVLGGAIVFGQQKQTAATVSAPVRLQDAVAAVDVDANALQAYDPAVRQTILGSGPQLWTIAVDAGDPVVMQAHPVASGVAVVAKRASQAASEIAPLPLPKPTPQ